MTFKVGYSKNDPTDDVETCAGIIKLRFKGITGSLIGLGKLKEIHPSGQTKIDATYDSTPSDGFSCLDGNLLQDNACGKSLGTRGKSLGTRGKSFGTRGKSLGTRGKSLGTRGHIIH